MVDLFRAPAGARIPLCATALVVLSSTSALAQSFDCAKASPPIETAICASSDLRAQDNALAGAYGRAQYALRDDSGRLDALKQAQRRWIAERNRACAADPARVAACLAESYRLRMAAIAQMLAASPAPPQALAQPASPQAAPQQPVQTPSAPAVAPVAQPPAAASPAPVAIAPPPAAASGLRIPIEPASAPADRESSALVTIPAPGRYSIRAQSATGVAIQLVDMIAGPGEMSGAGGVRDGRLDLLLDRGVYKLRTSGAGGAAGQAVLKAEAYRELAAPTALAADHPFSGDLGDLEQRSFWVDVNSGGRIALESLGRALQDMRLWRNGEDLVDLAPDIATIETRPGRAMTRVRLEGKVEAGRYLVAAYGGESRVWPDGGAERPFMIRQLVAGSLAAGLAESALGAFGSLRFEAPADFDTFRIETAQPAPVVMNLRRGGANAGASLARTSRDPFASARLSADGKTPGIVEISGFEGQAFRLRGLRASSDLRISGSGPTAVFVDVAGEGGDEIPATALLVRFEQNRARVLASDSPKIGAGQAWRRRFNLRGASTILFEMTSAGPVAVRTQGPAVRASIEPVLGSLPPRADGRAPALYNLEAGLYQLRLTPVNNAAGVLDLTLGQPGLVPDPSPSPPPRSALSLGVQQIERGGIYQALTNSAPGLLTGVRAIASPVDLGKGPVAIWQGLPAPAAPAIVAPAPAPVQPAPAPQRQGAAPPQPKPPAKPAVAPAGPSRPAPVKIAAPQPAPAPAPRPPVVQTQAPAPSPALATSGDTELRARAPLGGAIVARDQRGAAVPATLSDEKVEKDARTFTLHIPAATAPRAVAISWRADPKPQAANPGGEKKALETIAAGAPKYFDLAEGDRREFRLEAKEGGLYRVETLGRLVTGVTIGTSFLPHIGEGADNGPGRNGLVQAYLRAGQYRVAVSAKEATGRLGLSATPAPMLTTGVLAANGGVRATLANGRGAIAPIEIREAGLYRLDLYGLGRDFPARLEDADGWPLTVPGPVTRLDIKLEPGKYRLVVPPVDVDARMVARLRPVLPAVAPEGHGPHPLAFGVDQNFQWREPQAKDSPRTPDSWTFALSGETGVDLAITEGMVGEIIRGDRESVGKFVASRPFSGKLAAGAYRVETRALGRDDRLDYTLSLSSDALQPDVPRFVELPAKLDFVIAEDRVVNLTTFGRTDLKGVLKDANGAIVERLAGRSDDWNIALSRRLAAGRYTLLLSEMTADASAAAAASTEGDDQAEESDTSEEEASTDAKAPEQQDESGVEVRLALPGADTPRQLQPDISASAAGPQVHQFLLPPAKAGALQIIAARSAAELVLSVETRDAPDAPWRVVGFERGQRPLLAWPARQADKAQWRASVWSIDGASAQISVVARAAIAEPQDAGSVNLEPLTPVASEAVIGSNVRVGLARAPSAAIVNLATASDALFAGSSEGRMLARAESGALAPQSERLWFVSRDESVQAVKAPALAWTGEPIALALDAGESATLPAPAVAAGKARIWRARSALGQPGLDAGRGMAVAGDAALALDSGKPLRVWNAGGVDALRVDLDSIDVAVLPKISGASVSTLLPPLSAQPVTLPDGDKKIDVDLAGDTAAFAAPTESGALAVAASGAAVSRVLGSAAKEIWLVNLSAKPQPARLSYSPGKTDSVASDRVVKRFYGAAGSTYLHVDASAGDVLRVEGADATYISRSGRVLRGASLTLDQPGDVVLDHKPGMVAAWLERAGVSPWPKVDAQATRAPASARLEGAGMAFALKLDQAALIGVRTTAPVAIALEQGGRRELKLFAAGADFHRYVAAGDALLSVYSPHDGPLAGALDLTSTPVAPAKDGIGDPVALAPGASALFGFEVKRAGEIGVGLRAEPDRIEGRLLDAAGKQVGEGLAQIRKLEPGRYIVEARVPVDAPATIVRPAIVGLAPPAAGPPPEEVEQYLAKAGLKTNSKAR